ncbi:MAG: lytic transglycosylase domain-containing protein [Candidatus Kapabacteria bacterium]|nr:lytic transglycosylase domain-containing protein [Candidatus Kapabacteria bacterium]MDW7996984.1 lytic transglycosylase domain-containing protein [Bacteroidota bacterium]
MCIVSVAISCYTGKPVSEGEREGLPLWVSTARLPEHLEFCGEPLPLTLSEVRENMERELYILLQQPGQLVLYQKRAGRYLSLFEQLLQAAGMPTDLKYVAIAESALLPTVQSPKQAVGLWQFIPETARKMGLRVDEFVDERRHPERSTRAALRYLQQGYELFGNWTLAVAGYNMGHENLQAQLQLQGARSFYDAFLNEETTRYIYRIVAIKHVLQNAAQYGVEMPRVEHYSPPVVRIIRWSEAIPDLVEWARQQGVRYKDVRLLNPWILQSRLPAPPSGMVYEIALPR